MLTKSDLQQIDRLLEKRINTVKEDVAQIRKDVKIIVNFFDKEYLALRKRVERIEEHLRLRPIS